MRREEEVLPRREGEEELLDPAKVEEPTLLPEEAEESMNRLEAKEQRIASQGKPKAYLEIVVQQEIEVWGLE